MPGTADNSFDDQLYVEDVRHRDQQHVAQRAVQRVQDVASEDACTPTCTTGRPPSKAAGANDEPFLGGGLCRRHADQQEHGESSEEITRDIGRRFII